jgi:DNA (cytosine-5)-methyltransferase 1
MDAQTASLDGQYVEFRVLLVNNSNVAMFKESVQAEQISLPAAEQAALFIENFADAEAYQVDAQRRNLIRTVRTEDGDVDSYIPLIEGCFDKTNLAASFDASWLRARYKPVSARAGRAVRIVDIFSGCGGLSLGVDEAARACGLRAEHLFAVDVNADALKVFKANFSEANIVQEDVTALFPGELGDCLSPAERKLAASLGEIDFLVGGPPCQGHSDLNNHTRRADPRNSLFLRMARCAEVLRPRFVIIENVPGVVHDKGDVVSRTASALASLGYFVTSFVVKAVDLGVPQTRRRFVLIASRSSKFHLNKLSHLSGHDPRTFGWACGDLVQVNPGRVFDSSANHSDTNRARINYLFDHDLYDLPDEQRPDCHRLKAHSYTSVYGRLRWNEPVPTITRGFGSTGQGRFVHPTQRRSLTPHEAARLQFFPDFFTFEDVKRYAMQIIIGNAVPSKLAYVVGCGLLSGMANE